MAPNITTSALPMSTDSGGETNRIALAAAVLAAAAFTVAFLGVLLDYLSSSNAKHKCTACAIGFSARQIRYRWSFRSWKLRVKYPILNLDFHKILRLIHAEEARDVDYLLELRRVVRARTGWHWRSILDTDSPKWYHIASDVTVLIQISRADQDDEKPRLVTVFQLPWKAACEFLTWKAQHPLFHERRPRASWAQMLYALGVRDTSELRTRFADADAIPSNMDVPFQRISLFNLGSLAFLMGFTRVQVDCTAKLFTALGPFGSITTEGVPGWGKVIHFDGDLLRIRSLIGRCNWDWLTSGMFTINGKMTFGKYVSGGLTLPLETLGHAIKAGFSHRRFRTEQRAAIGLASLDDRVEPFNIFQEATLMTEEASRKDQEITIDRVINTWQATTKKAVPSIYVAAMFATFSAIAPGYPSKVLIEPFQPWLSLRAKLLMGRAFTVTSVLGRRSILSDVTLNRIFRSNSDFLLSRNEGVCRDGLYGWGISEMEFFFDSFPLQLQSEIFQADDNIVAAVLLSEVVPLLDKFDVSQWAQWLIDRQRRSQIGTIFKPINLIWLQLLITDTTIQLLIRSGYSPDGRWTRRGESLEERAERNLRAFMGSQIGRTPVRSKTSQDLLNDLFPDSSAAGSASMEKPSSSAATASAPGTNFASDAHEGGTLSPKSTMEDAKREERLQDLHPDDEDLKEILLSQSEDYNGNSTWPEQEAEVAFALSRSATLDPPLHHNYYQDGPSPDNLQIGQWRIQESLDKYCPGLFRANAEQRQSKLELLTSVLELRGLLLIAFYSLQPDSSDVYMAEDYDYTMPIA